MKNEVTRDRVVREFDVICFKMKAAGMIDVLPCPPVGEFATTLIRTSPKSGRGPLQQLQLKPVGAIYFFVKYCFCGGPLNRIRSDPDNCVEFETVDDSNHSNGFEG